MVNSKMNVYNLFASWWVEMHTRKKSQTGNQYVTCLQTLHFLLEIFRNSYENKNRKRGCYWPQAWCWEFFFSIQEIFSQGISWQVIFSPRNQSAGYMFFEITHIPPPSKVKWYESWVWSLMFGSANHALQKGISSLGWKKKGVSSSSIQLYWQ